MDDRSFLRVVVSILVVLIDLLLANASEKSGKAVKVILRPFFPRMVVALGALDADAEENLADIGGVVRSV